MLEVWIDGTCKYEKISRKKQSKTGHSAVAVVIKKDGKIIRTESQYVGVLDNNQAEYEALILAIDIVLDMNENHVRFYTDSNLVEKQMNFKYNCNSESLTSYYLKAKNMLYLIPCWEIKWISRKENDLADKMADKVINDLKNAREI